MRPSQRSNLPPPPSQRRGQTAKMQTYSSSTAFTAGYQQRTGHSQPPPPSSQVGFGSYCNLNSQLPSRPQPPPLIFAAGPCVCDGSALPTPPAPGLPRANERRVRDRQSPSAAGAEPGDGNSDSNSDEYSMDDDGEYNNSSSSGSSNDNHNNQTEHYYRPLGRVASPAPVLLTGLASLQCPQTTAETGACNAEEMRRSGLPGSGPYSPSSSALSPSAAPLSAILRLLFPAWFLPSSERNFN
ncbi:hypothetical protein TYRP_006614 [Tyrophagus putrescentiae]|nr:hypothetical protein TYRP_006614 [Tyrophagus putrescentiae]